MDVAQLSTEGKRKPLAQVGGDLNLHPHFGAANELPLTVVLLSRHVDELRMRLHFVETELRTPWWRRVIRRWRART